MPSFSKNCKKKIKRSSATVVTRALRVNVKRLLNGILAHSVDPDRRLLSRSPRSQASGQDLLSFYIEFDNFYNNDDNYNTLQSLYNTVRYNTLDITRFTDGSHICINYIEK